MANCSSVYPVWDQMVTGLSGFLRTVDTILSEGFEGLCGCSGLALLQAAGSGGRIRERESETGKEQE